MAEKTEISWTESTWNPITGCSYESPGCRDCYAATLAGTRLKNHPSRAGLTHASAGGPVWTGEVRFNEGWLDQPLQWKRPRMIFVVAHGDLFHPKVPDSWIDRVWARMAIAHWHTFQVLTKRIDRAARYLSDPALAERIAAICVSELTGKAPFAETVTSAKVRYRLPLPNVWVGTSIERQQEAVPRLAALREVPAAVRWVSAEPMLGPLQMFYVDEDAGALRGPGVEISGARTVGSPDNPPEGIDTSQPFVDWVVCGGENAKTRSARRKRSFDLAWARDLRDQCKLASVPFYMKQIDAVRPIPPDLMVREYPE